MKRSVLIWLLVLLIAVSMSTLFVGYTRPVLFAVKIASGVGILIILLILAARP